MTINEIFKYFLASFLLVFISFIPVSFFSLYNCLHLQNTTLHLFWYNIVFINSFFCVLLQVKNWVKELRKMLGNEICLCIVGKLSHMAQFNTNTISYTWTWLPEIIIFRNYISSHIFFTRHMEVAVFAAVADTESLCVTLFSYWVM